MIQLLIIWSNQDFNTEKTNQYEATRKGMAWKYSFGDADLFGPEEITAILEDKEESQQRKELVEKVKSEKTLIQKGFSMLMEKIKEFQSKISNAVKTGCRGGSGKLEMEFYYVRV